MLDNIIKIPSTSLQNHNNDVMSMYICVCVFNVRNNNDNQCYRKPKNVPNNMIRNIEH